MFPSDDLGFVDAKAESIEVELAGHVYTLRQSPGLLASTREGGTTGAVLWKITPLLASWLAARPALLSDTDILHKDATIVELGCGLTGLIGLALSRLVKCYVLTDQDYVMKYLRENIVANSPIAHRGTKNVKNKANVPKTGLETPLRTFALDWETDCVESLRSVIPCEVPIDLVLLCDCVYNEYLVFPLIQTCVDVCQLGSSVTKATVVLIAQQLRSNSVFELFLSTLMKRFQVWRVPDQWLSVDLRSNSGYVVHLAVLNNMAQEVPRCP